MPTFTDIPTLRAYVISTFDANGIADITGPEAQDAFIGILDLLTPHLKQQLVVNLGYGSESLGGSSAGETYTINTPIETVLRDLLQKPISPNYVLPTAPLVSDELVLDHELGAIISPEFTSAYTQNDAGVLSGRILRKDGTQIATAVPHEDLAVSVGASPIDYQLFTSHAAGVCKPNNFGDTDCTGRVLAGTINSNIITYSGYRKTFFGTPAIDLVTSADVRAALSTSALNLQNGSEFTIIIPATSSRVAFAYPDSLQDVSEVIDDETGANVRNLFTKTIINVEGANGFASVAYKVYVFQPIEVFPYSTTYKVKI